MENLKCLVVGAIVAVIAQYTGNRIIIVFSMYFGSFLLFYHVFYLFGFVQNIFEEAEIIKSLRFIVSL